MKVRLSPSGVPARQKAERPGTSPGPPRRTPAGFGARVARQRSPVLRAGQISLTRDRQTDKGFERFRDGESERNCQERRKRD
jgi:hypothetical protein